MHAMVWLGMVLFRAIQFGAARFCPWYTNLRQPHIFKHQIESTNLTLHSSKCVIYCAGDVSSECCPCDMH